MRVVVLAAAVAGCEAYYTDYTAEHRLAALERAAARGGQRAPGTAELPMRDRTRVRAPMSPGVLGDPSPPPAVSREGYPRSERRSPTDPSSDFDDRFERRTYRDDVNRLAPPSVRSPGVWERDFDPDR